MRPDPVAVCLEPALPTIYRNIEIAPANVASGVEFFIGAEGYCADSVEDARRVIDNVLDNECITHRGVLAAPVWEGALSFEIGQQRFTVNGPDSEARQFAARVLIDALLDRMN